MRIMRDMQAFTLIEILLASAAAALVLAAIYGVYLHAIKLRETTMQHTTDSRLRERASRIIRADLRNALVSGGLFASIVQGDSANSDGMNSSLPGYLKFTTTTGRDDDDNLYGDVQQVEYYVVKSNSSGQPGGTLVRSVTRDLLNTVNTGETQPTDQQDILQSVQSMQVAFYDGTNWQTSWSFNSADSSTSGTGGSTASTSGSETLPAAVRVDIQQMAPMNAHAASPGPVPPPLEILVPWTTQPFTSPTPAPAASAS